MKRLFLAASVAVVAMGVAACVRERPAPAVPTQTVAAVGELSTPTSFSETSAPGTVVALPSVQPTLPATIVVIQVPTETQGTPPAGPTIPPTSMAMSTSTPVPLASPTTPAPSGPTTYTVQWGDWLNKIAVRFGVTTQAILAANPELDANRIFPGQVINIPAPGTGATPEPSGATPPAGRPTTYTVQRGDWFYSIARKFGVSVESLKAANPGVNTEVVYAGQVLNIPVEASSSQENPGASQGQSYTVKAGDTLFSIAVRFHTTPYALQIANHLPSTNFIYPGQQLIIP